MASNPGNFFTQRLPSSLFALEPTLIAELDAALVEIGEQAKTLLKSMLNDPKVRASGKSAESIERDQKPLRVGGRLIMRIFPTGDRAQVMRYINDGRRPGKRPPIDAITEWMIEKELDVGMSDNELRAAAFAIARAIGERGIPGHKVFQKAQAAIEGEVQTKVRDAVERALRRLQQSATTGGA